MSVYNSEEYLNEAIESILNQTYKNFEFIIIDDGSTDKSLEVIKKYKAEDDRIVLISRENKGLPYSLNEGIGIAKGEYIARMDADDISLPSRFEEQVTYFSNNKTVDLLFTHANLIDDNSQMICHLFTPHINKVIKLIEIKNLFIHPTVMIKKKVFNIYGLYNTDYIHGQDWEYWKRVYKKTNIKILTMPLINYRMNFNSITMKRFGKQNNNSNYEYSKACMRNFDNSNLTKYFKLLSFTNKIKILLAKFSFYYEIQYFYMLLNTK